MRVQASGITTTHSSRAPGIGSGLRGRLRAQSRRVARPMSAAEIMRSENLLPHLQAVCSSNTCKLSCRKSEVG
jgi:hypothetical protein